MPLHVSPLFPSWTVKSLRSTMESVGGTRMVVHKNLHQEAWIIWSVIWCICKNNSKNLLSLMDASRLAHWETLLLWGPQPGTGDYTHTSLRPLSFGNSGVGKSSSTVKTVPWQSISPLLISSIFAYLFQILKMLLKTRRTWKNTKHSI